MAVQSINRTNAASLMKPEQVTEIIKMVGEKSKVLSKMRRLPNMTSKMTRMPILENLPVVQFVNGDTGRKATTKAEWKDKYITAEELAVIVPLPEAVLDDAGFNITAEIMPIIVDAFAKKIDEAILTGANRPASWPEGLMTLARNNGHIVSMPSQNSDQQFYKSIMGVGGLFNQVEADGFEVNGILGSVKAKAYVRGLTDLGGRPLSVGDKEINGIGVGYVNNGAWDEDKSLLLAGDFTKAVYSIRQDITIKKCTEGVIQDSDGAIVYNLMQNDMIALRFVMRLGWNIANPVTQANGDEATRFPISLLTENAPVALSPMQFTVNSDTGSTHVEGATVTFGQIERTTDAMGQCTISAPATAKGPYMVKKGKNVVYGEIEAASSSSTVTINNFPDPDKGKKK